MILFYNLVYILIIGYFEYYLVFVNVCGNLEKCFYYNINFLSNFKNYIVVFILKIRKCEF